MPLKKSYTKDKKTCKVTFILPADIRAKSAFVVGEFNNWDRDTTPMDPAPDGSLQVEVALPTGQSYQYRFFVDGSEWYTDSDADGYAAHPYGGENSLVIT